MVSKFNFVPPAAHPPTENKCLLEDISKSPLLQGIKPNEQKGFLRIFCDFFSGNLQVYRNWYLDSNNAFLVSVDSNSPPSGEFALYKYVRFKIVLNNLLSNCAKILSVVSLKMFSCQRSKYCIDTSKKERLLQNLPLWQRDELVEANVCRKSCCSKILSCTPSRLVWQIYSRRPAIKLNCKRKRLEIWLSSFLQNLKSDLRCLQKAIKRPFLDFEICLFVLIFAFP